MHQLENRLIAGQLPGGVGKIVVGDQFAADHLGQGVGIQHGLHDMVAELGRAELALSVGLHGQRGVEKPLVVAGAGLVQYNKIAGGLLRHGQIAGKTAFPQIIEDDFFDHSHFSAFRMELVPAFSFRAESESALISATARVSAV